MFLPDVEQTVRATKTKRKIIFRLIPVKSSICNQNFSLNLPSLQSERFFLQFKERIFFRAELIVTLLQYCHEITRKITTLNSKNNCTYNDNLFKKVKK